jgi:hypothetical protein
MSTLTLQILELSAIRRVNQTDAGGMRPTAVNSPAEIEQ